MIQVFSYFENKMKLKDILKNIKITLSLTHTHENAEVS